MAVCGNIDINPELLQKNKNTRKNKKDIKKYEPLVEKGDKNTKKYGGTCGNIS